MNALEDVLLVVEHRHYAMLFYMNFYMQFKALALKHRLWFSKKDKTVAKFQVEMAKIRNVYTCRSMAKRKVF